MEETQHDIETGNAVERDTSSNIVILDVADTNPQP